MKSPTNILNRDKKNNPTSPNPNLNPNPEPHLPEPYFRNSLLLSVLRPYSIFSRPRGPAGRPAGWTIGAVFFPITRDEKWAASQKHASATKLLIKY